MDESVSTFIADYDVPERNAAPVLVPGYVICTCVEVKERTNEERWSDIGQIDSACSGFLLEQISLLYRSFQRRVYLKAARHHCLEINRAAAEHYPMYFELMFAALNCKVGEFSRRQHAVGSH